MEWWEMPCKFYHQSVFLTDTVSATCYVVDTAERVGYSVIVLSEYSLPNAQGNYQRVRTIAEFGNSQQLCNWQNAYACQDMFTKKEGGAA